jgi:hypothetical protein
MPLVKGYVRPPDDFALRGPPFCGEDNERILLRASGRHDRVPPRGKFPRGKFWQVIRPELPWMMQRHLRKMGYVSRRTYVDLDDRLRMLHGVLESGRVAVIWVRPNRFCPIAAHMVTVLAYDPVAKIYLVMNDQNHRKVKRAHNPAQEVGNATWTEPELLRRWRNVWFRKTAAAAILWLP